jgi:hypothetical protein
MGPMMPNLGMGGGGMSPDWSRMIRPADPRMMQGSLAAAQVPQNKMSLFQRLGINPQQMGQMGLGLMQMGQRQPMGGQMGGLLQMLQSGLFNRRG